MTATETPLPVSGEPSAPVRVWVASRPRVASLEVSWNSSIGCLPASTYVTPGWLRTAWICDFVPTAPTTPILRKVVEVFMPVAVTADVAAWRFSPCTSTRVVPLRLRQLLAEVRRHVGDLRARARRGRGGQAGRGDDRRRAEGQ